MWITKSWIIIVFTWNISSYYVFFFTLFDLIYKQFALCLCFRWRLYETGIGNHGRIRLVSGSTWDNPNTSIRLRYGVTQSKLSYNLLFISLFFITRCIGIFMIYWKLSSVNIFIIKFSYVCMYENVIFVWNCARVCCNWK